MHIPYVPAESFLHRLAACAILALALSGPAVLFAQAHETQPAGTVPAEPEAAPEAQPGDDAAALPGEPEAGEDGEASAPVPAASGSAANGPGRVVEALHSALLEAMQHSSELGYEGRYRRIEPVITANFDTPLIVKVILSRYWDELTPEQQQEFVELFRRLSVATYASRFNDYDGEVFVEVGREDLKSERVLVKTEMRRPSGKPVRLDYLMHRNGNGDWLIISVIANGVNDLSLKRAEYAAVIREKGYDGLVADIRRKIADMERGVGA
jgi:phospholipid transport system substrate-binding protein